MRYHISHDDVYFRNGGWWVRLRERGDQEFGPSRNRAEAEILAERIAARDTALEPDNPEGQEATVDEPGKGYTVMSQDEQDAIIPRDEVALLLAGNYQAWQRQLGAPNSDLVRQVLQNNGMSRETYKELALRSDTHRGGTTDWPA